MEMCLGLDLTKAQQQRVMQLNELDEIQQDSIQCTMLVQYQGARWND